MQDGLTILVEPAGAVGHQTAPLGFPDLLAEVGLAGFAEFALATFWRVERDHMVTHRHAGDALADGFDNPAPFMAQNDREQAFGVFARQSESIGMANARGDNFDAHFASLRRHYVDFLDRERFVNGPGDGRFAFDDIGHGSHFAVRTILAGDGVGTVIYTVSHWR